VRQKLIQIISRVFGNYDVTDSIGTVVNHWLVLQFGHVRISCWTAKAVSLLPIYLPYGAFLHISIIELFIVAWQNKAENCTAIIITIIAITLILVSYLHFKVKIFKCTILVY